MSYKSPIKITNELIDEEVLKAVWKLDINVDKRELVKALNYDRGQYEKVDQDAEQKYKAALDEACEHLSEFDHFMYENGYENVENWNKDEWKEWLMKDEI